MHSQSITLPTHRVLGHVPYQARRAAIAWVALPPRSPEVGPAAGTSEDPWVVLNPESGNAKTGPIAVSTAGEPACPRDCPLSKACYGKSGNLPGYWAKVTIGIAKNATNWEGYARGVEALPAGALHRMFQVGDQPHRNGVVVRGKVARMTRAAKGRKVWTYSHHRLNAANVATFRAALEGGLVINASTESVEVADAVMTQHGLPAVAVVPSTETRKTWCTSSGRRVVACPATWNDGVSCGGGVVEDQHHNKRQTRGCGGEGGPLCWRGDRDYVIAFPAHGARKRAASEVASRPQG